MHPQLHFRMLRAGLLIGLLLFGGQAVAESEQRELAKKTFEWLRKRCLKLEEDPSQWAYDGCYSMHRSANCLYRRQPPRGVCPCPVSDYERGGYVPYFPTTHFMHEYYKAELIYWCTKPDYP